MKTLAALFWLLCTVGVAVPSAAADTWVEGTHYTRITPPGSPVGRPVVTEVFSYGCPACNAFLPTLQKLRDSLPKDTQFAFVPAGFIPAEDWPMFQRAYCTAQALNVADKAHEAMFKAVWATGELATMDPVTHALKARMPTLEDAAQIYQRVAGVKIEDFLATAKSFTVDTKIKAADQFIINNGVASTPTLIVDGKYRTDVSAAGGYDALVSLVKWLIARDVSTP